MTTDSTPVRLQTTLCRVAELMGEPILKWLDMAERRQLRRLRMWQPDGINQLIAGENDERN